MIESRCLVCRSFLDEEDLSVAIAARKTPRGLIVLEQGLPQIEVRGPPQKF